MALGEGTPKDHFNDTPKHKRVFSYLQLPIVLFNMDPMLQVTQIKLNDYFVIKTITNVAFYN